MTELVDNDRNRALGPKCQERPKCLVPRIESDATDSEVFTEFSPEPIQLNPARNPSRLEVEPLALVDLAGEERRLADAATAVDKAKQRPSGGRVDEVRDDVAVQGPPSRYSCEQAIVSAVHTIVR